MSWDSMIYFALPAVALWSTGAYTAWKEKRTWACYTTALGLSIFFCFILALWISLERPPLRNGRDAALVRFFPSAGRNHHLYQVEIQMDTKLQHAPRDCFHLHKPFQAGDTQQDADARTTKPMVRTTRNHIHVRVRTSRRRSHSCSLPALDKETEYY